MYHSYRLCMGCGLVYRGMGVRFMAGEKILFSALLLDQFWGPPIQWVPGALSPGVKWPGREANHWIQASAWIKNLWNYISTGISTSWSLIQGDLQSVKWSWNWSEKRFTDALCSKWEQQESSDHITTGHELDGRGIGVWLLARVEGFLFYRTCRLVLGSNQPPVDIAASFLGRWRYLRVKLASYFPLVSALRIRGAISSLLFGGCSLICHRGNFTFTFRIKGIS
jgi:hypothetical protein